LGVGSRVFSSEIIRESAELQKHLLLATSSLSEAPAILSQALAQIAIIPRTYHGGSQTRHVADPKTSLGIMLESRKYYN
jgi:hypothetical protein